MDFIVFKKGETQINDFNFNNNDGKLVCGRLVENRSTR